MQKKRDAEILEALIKSDKLKVIKPNECGLLYDEKRDRVITICNKDGKLEIKEKRLRPRVKAG
ncbi:MAG: hypothetical protein HY671_13245 [Chloroflexi bacterium]|nr:hypothetical protein [Chloroflexota bacterium]